jgi:hypothetical protein
MNASRHPLFRLLLAIFLCLALSADAPAAPPSPRLAAPQAAWFEWMPDMGRPTRTSVIRIAAVGMALALFIMYRNKH